MPPSPPAPGLQQITIVLPPSSFVEDTRSAYDGAIGGTMASSYIAIPGAGATPHRGFWFTQFDNTAQRGLNPRNFDPVLAAYQMVQVPLPAGGVDAMTAAAALEAAMAPFGSDYTVTQLGPSGTASWALTVYGAIGANEAFTGPSFAARGTAGLWGTRVTDLDQFAGYNQGPLSSCAAQYLQAPNLAGTRLVAMDVFVGTLHDPTSQIRLSVFEGGSTVDPSGSTVLYDFGEITGVDTTKWVRRWVDPEDVVLVGNGINLWNVTKSNGGPTNIGGVDVGSGGEGNFLDQDFWQSTTMNNDPAVPFEPVFSAGGMHGSNFIIGTRLIFQTPPYLGNGSWRRRYGTHVGVVNATDSAPFTASILMSGEPPPVLGMELEQLWVPYGNVHIGSNQFRIGLAQGGVSVDVPNGAIRTADLGQTFGTVVNTYAIRNAPGPGPFAIPVDDKQIIRWWTKSDDPAGSEIAFGNGGAGGLAAISPPESPMDWTPNGAGTNPEYEITAPNANIDPSIPFEVVVPATTVPPDARVGIYPFAALVLRVNGIVVIPS